MIKTGTITADKTHKHNPTGRKWTERGLERHLMRDHSSYYSYQARQRGLAALRRIHNEAHNGTQIRRTSPHKVPYKYRKAIKPFSLITFVLGFLFGVIVRHLF